MNGEDSEKMVDEIDGWEILGGSWNFGRNLISVEFLVKMVISAGRNCCCC